MFATGLVELNRSVEVAVIGDAQRTLAVRFGGQHQLFDPRRTVEHGVLGVVVQVYKAFSHSLRSSFRGPDA